MYDNTVILLDCSLAEIQLSPNASWDSDGITVAGWANGTNGTSLSQLCAPVGISISSNNILYVSDVGNHRIVMVYLDSATANFAIGSGYGSGPSQFAFPYSSFVTNSSLYVLDSSNNRVQKLLVNGSNPTTALNYSDSYGANYFYLDNDANIYLSTFTNHTVLLVHANSVNITIVAGTGVPGSNDDQLNGPYGLFVNSVRTIYIADCFNHRIMKWHSGASSGIRVAGNGAVGSSSTQLNSPTQIIVDSNEYMYISEAGNSRITRWAPNSTFGTCIVACTGISGSTSKQLHGPHSLAFDSYGALYVSDYINHRVQKFDILNYQSEYSIN